MMYRSYTSNAIHNPNTCSFTTCPLTVSTMLSCLQRLRRKVACASKPSAGGLIRTRGPNVSGWLELPRGQIADPYQERHSSHTVLTVVCGPQPRSPPSDPSLLPPRKSRSEPPFSPLKPNPTLASHDDFLRAQVVLPVIALDSILWPRLTYAPMQAAP